MAAFVTQGGLDDARNFVARVIALPVDGDGFIGIHNTWVPKGHKGGKLPFSQGVIASDPDDFIKKLPKLFTGNNRDIYVCMGTQRHHKETPNRKTGEIRYVPDKHKDNISRLKSLYIDVDFKGGLHGYPTETDAATAVDSFLAACGMPQPSVVVHTGGGYHLYWVFTHPLERDDWQVLANQLVEATRQHGFKCDTGCSIDPSRVLRVPSTLNYKYDPPRSVKIRTWRPDDYDPDDLAKILAKYPTGNVTPRVTLTGDLAAFAGVKPFQGFQSTDEITELGADCTTSLPIDLKQVYPECGFVRDALTTGGKNMVGDPLWNVTTLLAVFTKQGRGAAHAMAEQNQYYNADEQDKLYDRKELDRARGVGWPKCATIQSMGATQCAKCPHLSKGLYPFSFLTSPAAPLATGPTMAPQATGSPAQWPWAGEEDILPPGYQRDAQGLIFRVTTDEDGNNFDVHPSRSTLMWDAKLSSKPTGRLHFNVKIANSMDTVRVALLTSDVGAGKTTEMLKVLHGHLVHVEDDRAMREFLVAWIEKLKENRNTLTQYDPFGWAEGKDGIVGFAYAGKLYTPDGTLNAQEADTELGKQYHPRGDLNQWKRAAKLVTDTKRPAMDAILAAAFAAPLVYFTGEDGLYFGVHSEESGIGKTTTMRVAQSVWSVPGALQRLTDTAASVQQKMGTLRHLPIAWDELKGDENLRDMAKMIFELMSGRSKARLKSDISQRGTVEWRTMLVTASNNSMADHINELAKNNDAGFYRLFELKAEPLITGHVSLSVAGPIKLLLDNNCGVAGRLYAAYLGQKFALIQRWVKEMQARLEAEFKIVQAERNWLNVAVVLLVGAEIANGLELTEIDVPALKARLHAEIISMRGVLAETPLRLTDAASVSMYLLQYIRDNNQRMVITSTIWDQPGRPAGVALLYPVNNFPQQGIVGQFGADKRILRLAKLPLELWLNQHKLPVTTFKRALETQFGAKYYPQRTMGSGLPGFTGSKGPVYDFDCNLPNDLGSLAEGQITGTGNVVAFVKP